MKVALGTVLRATVKSAVGLVVVGGLLTGCGDDSTNPEAVDITELKSAFGLSLQDQGGGTVRLTWSGMNNEEAFSGYNVYGVKGDADIGAKGAAESTIQLLTSEGEQDAAGKALLQKMSYNGTDWETAGAVDPELDAEFQIVPYYTNKTEDDTPIIPTCRPSATGQECAALTAETMATPADYAFNGSTFLDVTGLKMGAEYCFTVASTLDEGSKISFTTSEVQCVVPRAEVEETSTAVQGKAFSLNLKALRESCDDAGTCDKTKLAASTEFTGAVAMTDDNFTLSTLAQCNASTPLVACIENFGDGVVRKVNFTAGDGGAIQDLGYFPGGFADSTFVPASVLTWDKDGIIHGGGYSLEGQSLPIENNHIYVVAESTDAESSNFYYHYIWVNNIADSSASMDFNMTIRVAQTAGDR